MKRTFAMMLVTFLVASAPCMTFAAPLGGPGHNNPGPSFELRESHREILNLFRTVENLDGSSFLNKVALLATLGTLSRKSASFASIAPSRFHSELRKVCQNLERARFIALVENNPREALKVVRRARRMYDGISMKFM